MKRLLNLCTIWFVLTLFLFTSLEVATRLYLRYSPTDNTRVAHGSIYEGKGWSQQFHADRKRHLEVTSHHKLYTPFSLWREHPFQSKTINVLDTGYRKTVQQPPIPDLKNDTTLVHFYGGSTLFSAQLPDNLTIPSLFAREASSQSNQTVAVSNYGIDGLLSTQEIHLLIEQLTKGMRPDVVIFYDGINDVFNRLIADTPHTFYPRFLGVLDRGLNAKETLLALSRKLAIIQILGLDQPEFILADTEIKKRTQQLLEKYMQQVELVKILAAKYSFTPVFVLQPNIFVGNKILTSEEQVILNAQPKEVLRAFQYAYPRLASAFTNEPTFLDCSNCFDSLKEPVYFDPYHVSDSANAVIAKELLKRISTN
jgi:lysophospholipase L1-like esterase